MSNPTPTTAPKAAPAAASTSPAPAAAPEVVNKTELQEAVAKDIQAEGPVETAEDQPKVQFVTFIRSYQPYNSGESAGFLPEKAASLIAAGVAVKSSKQQAEKSNEDLHKLAAAQRNAIDVRPTEEDLNARNSNPKSAGAPYAPASVKVDPDSALTSTEAGSLGSGTTGAESPPKATSGVIKRAEG